MQWRKRSFWLVALGLALAVVFVTPAVAQKKPVPGKADVVRPLGTVQVDPAILKVAKHDPISFKRFEILDPKTGKKIDPKTQLTLRNGKKMTAQAYYAELNKLEKNFNAIGYTLRDRQNLKPIELMQPVMDKTALERQVRSIKAPLRLEGKLPSVSRAAETAKQEQAAAQQRADKVRVALKIVKPKAVHDSRNWSYSVGKTSTFQAYLKGNLNLDGSVTGTSISEDFRAGAYIFGKHAEVLHQTGNANAPAAGSVKLLFKVDVLGSTVYNFNESDPHAKHLIKNFSKTVDFHTKIHFTIGPIPMSAKIGANGDAGVDLGAFVAHSYANGSIRPFVHTSAYVQAGVDIGIASAGAGAKLTLLNDELTLAGKIAIVTDSSGKLYFDEYLAAYNDLEMLNGKVYVYASVDLLLYEKEWRWTIWNWKGFKFEGWLFKEAKKTPLL